MKSNFYNMIFVEDNLLPFYRKGIPVTLNDKHICINGLGRYRIFQKPEEITDYEKIEEYFSDYSLKAPWVGQEEGKFYLYRAQINEDYLYFEDYDEKFTYLQINTNVKDMVTVLNGKIFFRNFIEDKQVAMIRFSENTMVTIEKEEGLIMVELVDGKFTCR